MPQGKPGAKPKSAVPARPAAPPAPRRPFPIGKVSAAAGAVAFLTLCSGSIAYPLTKAPWILALGIPILVAAIAVAVITRRDTWFALRRRAGRAPGVGELARRLGVPEAELRAFRPSYREVRIPKKRGGLRLLHVPDDATKRMQRRVLHRLLARIPSHPAAFGFERGRSIAHHAAQHAGRARRLRFDVVDFFPSTRAERIRGMFHRLGWGDEATEILLRTVVHEGGLPQGAPTSPRLSNLVNRAMDADLDRLISRRAGRYTRYADDVVVSFPEDWIGMPETALAVVREGFARRGYRLHGKEKSSVRRRHQRQVVNGLVVNAKVALPRRTRRLLRAARHHAATGRPCTFTPAQLEGWSAFERMVRTHGAETPAPWERRRPSRSARRRA